MNKKFLIGALLVALSTAGYAYDEVGTDTLILGGSIPSRTDINNNFDAVQNDVNDIKGQIDKINTESGKNWESVQNDLTDLHNNKANKDDVENALAEKVDKENFDKLNNKVTGLDSEIGQITSDVTAMKDNMKENNTAIEGLQGQVDKINTEIGKNWESVQNDLDDLHNNKANKDDVENALAEKVDKENFDKLNNKVTGLDNEIGQITSDVAALQGDINNKVNKDEFEQATDNLQQQIDKNNHISQETDKQLNNKIDEETSKLNDKIDANKAEQADKDAAQDAEIAKGDRIDKVQNQQIGNLQSQNIEQDKNIQANKDAIAANKAEQDKVNAAQKENNEQQQAAIDKNTSDIKDHGNRLDTLENNFAQYDGRLSGLEKKVDHLDDKMNKGLSLMAAMNAVDFQNVQTGEMAIGAGVGHYGNAQSVALGVAYSPVEDLTVNAKYSVTAGDADSFAVGAGATYKFKVGR